MLCSGEQIMTGQVLKDRNDPWRYDYMGISTSVFIPVPVGFFIVLVWNKIGSKLCCDIPKVNIILLCSVKMDSLYAFGRLYLSVLYKIEANIQY